jgi:hypothetical protein
MPMVPNVLILCANFSSVVPKMRVPMFYYRGPIPTSVRILCAFEHAVPKMRVPMFYRSRAILASVRILCAFEHAAQKCKLPQPVLTLRPLSLTARLLTALF